MQEHPVLDVLSATNHGGQAALLVCFVMLCETGHTEDEQEPGYLHDSKDTCATDCYNSKLIL